MTSIFTHWSNSLASEHIYKLIIIFYTDDIVLLSVPLVLLYVPPQTSYRVCNHLKGILVTWASGENKRYITCFLPIINIWRKNLVKGVILLGDMRFVFKPTYILWPWVHLLPFGKWTMLARINVKCVSNLEHTLLLSFTLRMHILYIWALKNHTYWQKPRKSIMNNLFRQSNLLVFGLA